MHNPDRLARKYAWQVLLLDELPQVRRHGRVPQCSVGHERPKTQLLVQVQGMIAEYERAKILGRSVAPG